jgi:hypothetical protein
MLLLPESLDNAKERLRKKHEAGGLTNLELRKVCWA